MRPWRQLVTSHFKLFDCHRFTNQSGFFSFCAYPPYKLVSPLSEFPSSLFGFLTKSSGFFVVFFFEIQSLCQEFSCPDEKIMKYVSFVTPSNVRKGAFLIFLPCLQKEQQILSLFAHSWHSLIIDNYAVKVFNGAPFFEFPASLTWPHISHTHLLPVLTQFQPHRRPVLASRKAKLTNPFVPGAPTTTRLKQDLQYSPETGDPRPPSTTFILQKKPRGA